MYNVMTSADHTNILGAYPAPSSLMEKGKLHEVRRRITRCHILYPRKTILRTTPELFNSSSPVLLSYNTPYLLRNPPGP
jgi:hypothetical protein